MNERFNGQGPWSACSVHRVRIRCDAVDAAAYAEDSADSASSFAANSRAIQSVAPSSLTDTGEDSNRDRTMPSAEGIDEVVQRNLSKIVLSSTERVERYSIASDIITSSFGVARS